MRRWKLLQDLPWAGEGTESQESPVRECVRFGASHTMYADFPLWLVERKKEWFEEIKPKKVWVIEVRCEPEDLGISYVAVCMPGRDPEHRYGKQRIEER